MKGFCDAVEGEVGVKGGDVMVGFEVWLGRTSPSTLVRPFKATIGSGDS
jgi:hypothetical protein